jgi:glycosyltransferase involved in cell wall biosynthesis
MWVGVFPELSKIGGIQQVSRHAAAVLAKRARERNVPCELLGLNDARGRGSFKVGAEEFRFAGFGRNKFALFLRLCRQMPRIEKLYLGHVNLAPFGLLLRMVRPRAQTYVVAHGIEVWEPLPAFRLWGLRRAQTVISVSAYTKAAMIKTQNLDPQKIFVLSPPLDPSFTQEPCDAVTLPLPSGGRMLLTVGRLISSEPGKGIDSVIKALPKVMLAIPEVFYVVVGEGDLQPRLEEMALENSVRDQVIFVGATQLDQLKSYYSRADVFVMPSRQEGFGSVFVEAMAFGKPVIAGDHGGAPDIVQDGVTGFLVNPDDLEALTLRLIELLQNETLCVGMGAAGRQRVEANFTFTRFEDRLTKILDGWS